VGVKPGFLGRSIAKLQSQANFGFVQGPSSLPYGTLHRSHFDILASLAPGGVESAYIQSYLTVLYAGYVQSMELIGGGYTLPILTDSGHEQATIACQKIRDWVTAHSWDVVPLCFIKILK
jgi:hypothetical protein